MNMSTVQHRKIVTQNLYAGEKALKNFRAEFPCVNSNTRYNQLIERHRNNEDYAELLPKIKGKSILAGLKLDMMRTTYNQTPNKLDYLKLAVKQQKVANCQERSFLIHNQLEQMGVDSQNVRINFVPNNGENIHKNHAFTVIGLDKNADLANPQTWGKNAVIVDAWANIVKRASEGIDYIKDLFKYNPNAETCEYSALRNM